MDKKIAQNKHSDDGSDIDVPDEFSDEGFDEGKYYGFLGIANLSCLKSIIWVKINNGP